MFIRVAVVFVLCLMATMPVTQARAQEQTPLQAAQEKALVGKWFSEQREPLAPNESLVSGEFRFASVDEYLANGVVNTQGQMIIFFKYKDGATTETAWLINATSEWKIRDGTLFEHVIDVQAVPDYVKANGMLADGVDREEFFRQANFSIEDLMPKGQSTQDLIISIDGDRFAYEMKDGTGKMIRQTKARTQKNFSAFRKF